MVKVDNPDGGRVHISFGAAESMISAGLAVATCRVNGLTHSVRLMGKPQYAAQALTARGYDAIEGNFYDAARHITVIAPQKMIREEKSPRDWSYRTAVRRNILRVRRVELSMMPSLPEPEPRTAPDADRPASPREPRDEPPLCD